MQKYIPVKVAEGMKKHSKKWYVQWGSAALLFCLCTVMYMGTATVTSCRDSFYGSPADSSGGVAWFQWADGNDPIWDYTQMSNFPHGESLKRPQFVTSYGQFIPYWFFSVLTNQICGLNIMVFLGFLTSALAMFGLVRWLTKHYAVAIFAGYAAAFVPYHVINAEGHVAYVYGTFFSLMIWAFLAYWRKPSYRLGALVAIVYALSLYFDGYFVLISTALLTVLLLALVSSYVLKAKAINRKIGLWIDLAGFREFARKHMKHIILALMVVLVAVTPIAYVYVRKGAEIQNSLDNARSSIDAEAKLYGAHVEDYLLPNPYNPLLPSDYANWRVNHIHGSNITESTLYIGLTVITLATGSLLFAIRERKSRKSSKYNLVIAVSLGVIILLGLLALPPELTIFGISIKTPSSVLIGLTAKWRVLSRLFLAAHAAWVLLASIGLLMLIKGKNKRIGKVIIVLAFAAIFIEFMPTPWRSWSMEKDSPQIYKVIKNDASIKAIAEYPVTDHPSSTLPYTFTFQQIHGKPLLNANDIMTSGHYLRQSIAGIADAQTVKVLRALGVNMVTAYDLDGSGIVGLGQYREPDNSAKYMIGTVNSYRVLDGEKAKYALVAREGFTSALDKKKTKSTLLLHSIAHMTVQSLGKESSAKTTIGANVKFNVAAIDQGAYMLNISQDNQMLWSGVVEGPRQVNLVTVGDGPIQLKVVGSFATSPVIVTDPEAY